MFMKLISSFGRRLALYEDLAAMTLPVLSGSKAGSELQPQGRGRAVGVGPATLWDCPVGMPSQPQQPLVTGRIRIRSRSSSNNHLESVALETLNAS